MFRLLTKRLSRNVLLLTVAMSASGKYRIIITILKSNKDYTLPSTYRPITPLCTPSKIGERLTFNKATSHIPLAAPQHGLRALHSTATLLTNLAQHVSDGINSNTPPERTLITTIDIQRNTKEIQTATALLGLTRLPV